MAAVATESPAVSPNLAGVPTVDFLVRVISNTQKQICALYEIGKIKDQVLKVLFRWKLEIMKMVLNSS